MPPRLLLAVAFAAGVLGGCFLSPNVPPSFRYACETDDDCLVLNCRGDEVSIRDAEAAGLAQGCDTPEAKDDQTSAYAYRQRCVSGLCQFPCELATFQDDCPTGKGYNFCFNGSCSSLCGLDTKHYPDPDSTCPDPQKCAIFGEDIDTDLLAGFLSSSSSSSGSSSPLGGSSSVSLKQLIDQGAGVCGLRCDADGAPPCAPGEYCSGALCLPGCDQPGAVPCVDGQKCVALGGFSACLATCSADIPCPSSQVCVPGLDVCVTTCVGVDAVPCVDGFTCDPTLEICLPDDIGSTSGSTG